MVRLIKKEDRLSNKNENYYIKEGKQVGNLYHVCTLDAFVNRIIEDKELGTKDNLHSSGKYKNALLKTYDAVSFTRDPLFVVPTWTVQGAQILFQFVIDGDKLSDRYKITPYNGNYTDSELHTHPKYFEKEEVVIGPITNFKSYIKEVRFDIKNLIFKDTTDVIEDLEKVKEYLGSIKCTRTTLPFLDDDWGHNYKKTSKEYELYKVKTLDELITLLNSIEDISIMDYVDTKDLFNKYMSDLSENQIDNILKEHPNWLNISDFDSLISTAIRYNSLPIMKLCVKNGADINKPYKSLFTQTPLYASCQQHKWDIALWLLDHGADPNIKNKFGNKTPLMATLPYLNVEVIKSLLEHDASVENIDASLIYSYCITNGASDSTKVLKLLLEHGLDANAQYDGKPFLFHAIAFIEKFKLLLDHGADPNVKNDNNQTILFSIVEEHDDTLLDYVKLLIRYGADVNSKNGVHGYTPLQECFNVLSYNEIPDHIVEYLLEHGANPNDKDVAGDTPFSSACYFDISLYLFDLFIKSGADVNNKDKDNKTPLYHACNNNIDKNIIKLLLIHGADPNIKDKNGETPLYWACNYKDIDKVKILLVHGADPNIMTENGVTPLGVACAENSKDIAKLLLDSGANPEKATPRIKSYLQRNDLI